MKFFTLFSLLLIAISIPFTSQADVCIVDNTLSPNGDIPFPAGVVIGQQFIACETGDVASVQVQVKFTGGTGSIDLYLVEGNGSTVTIGSPFQTFTGQADGLLTLPLSAGSFPVTEGTTYAFGVGGADISMITFDNAAVGAPANPNLPNGLFVFSIDGTGAFAEQMPSDLVFGVNINFTPIPTMSEWGLMIFGLLVLNLGVLGIRRKEMQLL